MLLIIGPEKPIDETEAEEIYKFVTEKGGKVIVASDNSNANLLSNKFGVTYFDYKFDEDKGKFVGGLLDQNQHCLCVYI